MNIADPIRRLARTIPDAPAFQRQNRAVSYAEFDRTIDAVARRALAEGLSGGDTVGLWIPDEPGTGAFYRFLVAAYALARIGVALKSTKGREAGFAACMTSDPSLVTGPKRRILVDDAWFDASGSRGLPDVESHPGGPAICRYFSTSGTTGTAKSVAISHDLIYRRNRDARQLGPYPDHPVAIVHVGPWTGIGFRHITRALWAGGTVVPARRPRQILDAIAQYGVNCMLVAPAVLREIVDALPDGADPPRSLQSVEVTGSQLPRPLYELTRRRLCPNIISSYGSSEGGNLAWAWMSDLEGKPDAVGFVVPGMEVEAVDEDDRVLAPGTVGALRIRGDTLAGGYAGDDGATAKAFRAGWFYPGDLGSVTEDGLLSITGRASDVINIGGNKVSARVIEDALLQVPGVADAAAFGMPDSHGIPSIWAAIVANGAVPQDALDATCRGLGFAAPKRIVRVAELPRNENGKLLRGELASLVSSGGADVR